MDICELDCILKPEALANNSYILFNLLTNPEIID